MFLDPIKDLQAGWKLDEHVISKAFNNRRWYNLSVLDSRRAIRTGVNIYGPTFGSLHKVQKAIFRYPSLFSLYFFTRRNFRFVVNIGLSIFGGIMIALTIHTYAILLLRIFSSLSSASYLPILFGLAWSITFGQIIVVSSIFLLKVVTDCFHTATRFTSILADRRQDLLRTVEQMKVDLFPEYEKNKYFLFKRMFDRTIRLDLEEKIQKDPTDIVWEFSTLEEEENDRFSPSISYCL